MQIALPCCLLMTFAETFLLLRLFLCEKFSVQTTKFFPFALQLSVDQKQTAIHCLILYVCEYSKGRIMHHDLCNAIFQCYKTVERYNKLGIFVLVTRNTCQKKKHESGP